MVAVATVVDCPYPGKESVVARATPARDGRDGSIVRLFSASPAAGARLEDARADGAVDAVGSASAMSGAPDGRNVVKGWVAKGEALVRIEPPEPGVDGVDVTGQPLRARHGAAAAVERGLNVHDSPDGLHVVASIYGQAWFVGGTLVSVVPVLRMESIEGQTIQYSGTVVVDGSIGPRCCIIAAWDVVAGRIECSEVSAGGDILVDGGVTACTGRGLLAGGDFRARFVETSTIQAPAGRSLLNEPSGRESKRTWV
jgi:uncharacterized protein (DUF342 family)